MLTWLDLKSVCSSTGKFSSTYGQNSRYFKVELGGISVNKKLYESRSG